MSIAETKSEWTKRLSGGIEQSCKCTHCGLPVPIGLLEPDSENQFCCGGCKAAFVLIQSSGLESFYAMIDSLGQRESLTNRSEQASAALYQEFDQPSFTRKFGQRNGEIQEISLLLDGVHCAACIWLIEKLPRMLPGVQEVKLNWARQTALIRWQDDQIKLSRIAETLDRLGYAPHPVHQADHDTRRTNENRQHLLRIGIAAACAGNNMLIATALYLGMFSYMSGGMVQLLRIASCVVGLFAFIGPGRVFLRGALNAFRTRTPHMDLPIALGLIVGSVAGVINTVRGTGEVWFDSLSALIFLLLVGRWIQFRQQNRAADSVELLYRLTPKTTRKIVDTGTIETFVDLVEVDDLVEIRPGELFPVDGVIEAGETRVDESILSGESCSLSKSDGDGVLAGTQNLVSVVKVRATATGFDTRLSKIVRLVEQASLDKPQIVQWANQIGGYFVIAVIILAAINLIAWIWIDSAAAFDRTVALLIVACPCALALATPLAVSVAIGRAARRRIMVKSGDVFQLLNRPGMLWLDKTGTLTEGKIQVVQWHGNATWAPLVKALEAKSSHPIAAAIVDYLDKEEVSQATVENIVEASGQGIRGLVKGQNVVIGNQEWLRTNAIFVDNNWRNTVDEILSRNMSPCWVAVNGKVIAVLALGDRIRSDTRTAIEYMRNSGWEIGILSGDHEQIVEQVAARLDVPNAFAFGGLGPEDKVKIIQGSLRENNTVVMVGDGVNDSAALASASCGIAVHNSAEASLAAAPVYLANEGLHPILELLQISRSTAKTIRRNLTISIAYNVAGVALAIAGIINPLIAAVLMPLSSLTVVAISLTAGKNSRVRCGEDRT